MDPDVWLRHATKTDDSEYYEYIFVYVDDLLVLSEKPYLILKTIGDIYRLKDNSVAKPTTYLGAVIKEHKIPDEPNKIVWSMSADKYVKETIQTFDNDLLAVNMKLPANIYTPLVTSFHPELDFSLPLEDDYANWYQQLIGTLRWAIEICHIDIHLSIALLAQYLAQPRVGHSQQAFHVFTYLKTHPVSCIILDDSMPHVYESQFTNEDLLSFYPDAQEAIPLNATKPLGNEVLVSSFMNADHAEN